MNARRTLTTFFSVLLSASLAFAAGGGGGGGGSGGGAGGGDTGSGSGSATIDPEYAQAVSAIEARQYDKAITLLQSYLTRANGTDAYAENWIAYSYRKSGQLDQAFLHYDKALEIDPRHRGAHSYLGEAYLLAGNVPKAEEHLRILDKLCFLPCDEYTALKKEVAYYKQNGRVDPNGK